MFSTNELRQNLLGCLEIALFMRGGAERFGTDARAMKKSFLIPVMVLPVTLLTVLAAHPYDDLTSGTANILMLVYSLRLVVYLAVFLSLIYFMAKNMNRLESFYRFATANNWLVVPMMVLMAAPLIGFFSGHYTWTDVQPLLVLITLYSYIYTAFMATCVMRIPWELAGFVAITGMAIHQTSLDLLKWAAVNAVYLVG